MDASTTQAPPPTPDAVDIGTDSSEAAPASSFNWTRFITYAASVLVIVIIGGLVAGMVMGKKTLDQRTTQVVGAKITGVEIDWPTFRAKSKGHTDIKAASPQGPATTTVDNRNVDIIKQGKKTDTASKPTTSKTTTTSKGKKYPTSPVEFPPDPPAAKPQAPQPTAADLAGNTWLPEQFQQELKRSAMKALGDNPDPLSREPLDRVAQAMEDSCWFASRPTVERQASGLLKVHGNWRIPVGVIASGDREVLLAADGAPLPVVYDKGQSGMSSIIGLAHPPAPSAAGSVNTKTTLADDDAQASLELFLLLKRQPWAAQVASVDASSYLTTKRLAIVTTAGNRIEWGGKPSKPLVGEITTKGKLSRMEEFNQRFGAIDARQARLEIYGPFMLVDYSQNPPDKQPDEPKDGAKAKPGDKKPATKKPTDG